MRAWTLALKNMERLLQHTYPGVAFELSRPGNSNTNITVQWMGYPDTPQGDEVDAVLAPFVGQSALMDLVRTSTDEQQAFRRAYGGIMQVSLKRGLPSNEDMVAWRERKLEGALASTSGGAPRPRL